MHAILISFLVFCILEAHSHVTTLYLLTYYDTYSTSLVIGNSFVASFVISTQSPYTFVPMSRCNTCSYPKFECNTSSTCYEYSNYISYTNDRGEYFYANFYSDTIRAQDSSRTAQERIDFAGIQYVNKNTTLMEYDSILGLNYLQDIPGYTPFYKAMGWSKVIGLHFPHHEISFNGYNSGRMNGSIRYFDIFNPSDASMPGWYVKMNIFRVGEYSYSTYSSGSYLSFDTSEPFMIIPENDFIIIRSKFCSRAFCSADNNGNIFIQSSSQDIQSYSIGNIELIIGDKVSLTLYPSDYLSSYHTGSGNYYIILKIKSNYYTDTKWIIGNMVLSKCNLILDGENYRIGFVSSTKITLMMMMMLIGGSIVLVVAIFFLVCCLRKRSNPQKTPLLVEPISKPVEVPTPY